MGQSGPVWFLAGTFGTLAERRCVVPADKAILMSMINTVHWIPLDGSTVAELRSKAKAFVDHTTELEVIVDGVPLQGLHNFRFRSPSSFSFTTNGLFELFGLPEGAYDVAVSEGFWVMLEPLSVGQHTLKVRGKTSTPATFPDVEVFEVTVIWHLTVQ